MFEGDFADMCGEKFSLMLMRGRAEGCACANPVAPAQAWERQQKSKLIISMADCKYNFSGNWSDRQDETSSI